MAGLFMLPSCVQQTYMITDNAVGTKTGVAKLRMFGKDKDISIETAAKNGKITKIGTVEMRVTYFIIPFVKTVVTGE
jgi:NADH:ubiquinone oxidoreductase subunit F (NADH-binding)